MKEVIVLAVSPELSEKVTTLVEARRKAGFEGERSVAVHSLVCSWIGAEIAMCGVWAEVNEVATREGLAG